MRSTSHSLLVLMCLLPALAVAAPSAADATSARQFFETIYRHYGRNGKGIAPLSAAGAKVFDRSFRALVRADARAAGPGQVGVIDADPLCACQDWDSVGDLSVTLRPGPQSMTLADVSFTLGDGADARRRIEFTLVRAKDGWRIHNAIDRTDAAHPFDPRAAILYELSTAKKHVASRPKSIHR